MVDGQFRSSTAISQNSDLIALPAKFGVGDRVYWFRVPTQDFGTVVDRFYGTEGSVQSIGWHYSIQLDPDSPSFAYCKMDYGFEEDLELMEKNLDATESTSD